MIFSMTAGLQIGKAERRARNHEIDNHSELLKTNLDWPHKNVYIESHLTTTGHIQYVCCLVSWISSKVFTRSLVCDDTMYLHWMGPICGPVSLIFFYSWNFISYPPFIELKNPFATKENTYRSWTKHVCAYDSCSNRINERKNCRKKC